MRSRSRWNDDELIPFWFTEAYVVVPLFTLGTLFLMAPVPSWLFAIAAFLASYRLAELAVATASILVFEPDRRSDEQGGYILARDRSRWIALTLLNVLEILVYFAFFHLTFSYAYDPPIESRLEALYQSAAAFIAGGGATPTKDVTRILGLLNFLYFVLFFTLAAPAIFSLVRAKEKKQEQLGESTKKCPLEPDQRL